MTKPTVKDDLHELILQMRDYQPMSRFIVKTAKAYMDHICHECHDGELSRGELDDMVFEATMVLNLLQKITN